jgi:putative aldouronate transport system permease protein
MIVKKPIKSISRKTWGDIAFDTVNYALLTLIGLVILYPLIFVISASFSEPFKVTGGQVLLWPVNFQLGNYAEVLKNADIMAGYRNSLIIMSMGTVINLTATISAAFPLSRRDLWGRGQLMMIATFTMIFSGGIIPLYMLIMQLNLINSWFSLILPGAISTYNLIIMRTYFQTAIPFEIQEAATIDGCSNIGILFRVILPLSGPIIAVIGLYYAVVHWNAYFSALMYIRRRELYPLQLFLREVLVINAQNNMMDTGSQEMALRAVRIETMKYSIIVLSSLPMLAIYPFVQRFFVKGVMIGSVKG